MKAGKIILIGTLMAGASLFIYAICERVKHLGHIPDESVSNFCHAHLD